MGKLHTLALILFIFLLVLGCLVRVMNITMPPDDIGIARQYNCLLISRGYEYRWDSERSVDEKRVAEVNLRNAQHAECPMHEILAAGLNVFFQRDSFWSARVLPIVGWMLGAVFLFLLCLNIGFGSNSALLATAYYLLNPFGILISRSFQPDSLMVGLLIMALWSIERYARKQTVKSWLVALLISSVAIFVKPGVTYFTICAVYSLYELRVVRSLANLVKSIKVYSFGIIILVPSLVYSVVFLAPETHHGIERFASGNFIPEWFLTFYFWKGWIYTLLKIFSPFAFVGGILGLFCLARDESPLVVGWCVGYLVISLLSTYTTPSHDYWHIQIIPFIAMGVGFAAHESLCFAEQRLGKFLFFGFSITAICFIGGVFYLQHVKPRQVQGSDLPGIAQEVGEFVDHSTNCIFLAYNYGRTLCYHGGIAGKYWPETTDLWAAACKGEVLSSEERYELQYEELNADYFIIFRNGRDFDKQRDLKAYLTSRFPVIKSAPRYTIYDLQIPKQSDVP